MSPFCVLMWNLTKPSQKRNWELCDKKPRQPQSSLSVYSILNIKNPKTQTKKQYRFLQPYLVILLLHILLHMLYLHLSLHLSPLLSIYHLSNIIYLSNLKGNQGSTDVSHPHIFSGKTSLLLAGKILLHWPFDRSLNLRQATQLYLIFYSPDEKKKDGSWKERKNDRSCEVGQLLLLHRKRGQTTPAW